MRTSARPRLPDGDYVFISGARIVARADAPFIAADMTWLGLTPPRRALAHIAFYEAKRYDIKGKKHITTRRGLLAKAL